MTADTQAIIEGIVNLGQALRAEMQAVRTELKADIADARKDLTSEVRSLRLLFEEDMASLRRIIYDTLADHDKRMRGLERKAG